MIAQTNLKLIPNKSTLVAIIGVRDREEPVTTTEQQEPYWLQILSTEMVLAPQTQRSEDQLKPVPELRSERRIVTAGRIIGINP